MKDVEKQSTKSKKKRSRGCSRESSEKHFITETYVAYMCPDCKIKSLGKTGNHVNPPHCRRPKLHHHLK